ncbi:MAG: diguanylate cyclase [Gammaproteobacteria bacterium]
MKPAIRISLGIVALSTSLLLLADTVFGIFPDPNAAAIEARLDLSESLGVQYTSMVASDRLPQLEPAMEALVNQRADVLSLSLVTSDGSPVATTSRHAQLWTPPVDQHSTPTQIQVPVLRASERWGTLQIRFDDLPNSGILGLLRTPLYKLAGIMAAGGFFAYLLYMSRTLRYLDPSSVVPDRVRAAMNQLVEGVFILDEKQRIVLVNNAFARNLNLSSDELMGANPRAFDWIDDAGDVIEDAALPWAQSMVDGARREDVRLKLRTSKRGTRVFSCNVSPISDKNGQRRGILASLDDTSEVETANAELRRAFRELEKANAEVKKNNDKLYTLATVDALTGCLNRRAFLSKLETEFRLARRDELDLCVVMADIDHFKSINDKFGHATGDEVIKQMAGALSGSARANDCVGRLGGEEFCMLLVGADAKAAVQVANRAREAFARNTARSSSATNGRTVTASFGVSSKVFGASDAAQILDQSDQALYASKHGGRNRVTSWADIDSSHAAVS